MLNSKLLDEIAVLQAKFQRSMNYFSIRILQENLQKLFDHPLVVNVIGLY